MPHVKTYRAIAIASTLIFASASIASAAQFTDVSGTTNQTAILFLANQGVIAGYADGSFRPQGQINRAELSKILVTGARGAPSVNQYHSCFLDVGTEWFAPYVCYAKAQGWVAGYSDGTFRPSNPVNTAEALKMILNAQGFVSRNSPGGNTYSDVDTNAWYAPFVETAASKNLLMQQSGRLGISSNITRGSVAESIYRSMTIRASGAARFPDNGTSASSSSVVAIDNKRVYRDGTYSALGNYQSPGGNDQIQLIVTLKNNVIIDSTFKGTAQEGNSMFYQQIFGDGYKEQVIGKSINEVSVTFVNGSSLTPIGFMDALEQIKAQAKAS